MDRLKELALQEIALEGPGGCPLQDFWQVFFAACKRYIGGAGDHPAVRERVWQQLRADTSGSCIFFRPPSSSSDEDRKKCRDITKDAPENWAENVLPCSEVQSLDMEEAERTGVWLLASQESQDAALAISDIVSGGGTIPASQRAVLAMAAKSRHTGILQVEMAEAMGISHKNFHYLIKVLAGRNLIVRHNVFIEVMKLNSTLIFHCRFNIEIPVNHRFSVPNPFNEKAHIVTVVSDQAWLIATCDKLEAQPDRTMLESLLKRQLGALGKAGHRLWRRVRLKLETTDCISVIVKSADEKNVPFVILNKHWREVRDDEDGGEDKALEAQDTAQVIPGVFKDRRFLEALLEKGEEGVASNEVSSILGLIPKRTLRYLEDIKASWGLVKVTETDRVNKKTLCYRFKAPAWLLEDKKKVPDMSCPSEGWLAAVVAATDAGKLQDELESMEGVVQSLVEVPKDWMLSMEELVAALQKNQAADYAPATESTGDPDAPAEGGADVSLDGFIATAANIDREVNDVRRQFSEKGFRSITCDRAARLLGLVLRNPPFVLARRAYRVLKDGEEPVEVAKATVKRSLNILDRKSFRTVVKELAACGLVQNETVMLAPPRCKHEQVQVLMPIGQKIDEEIKAQMAKDVLAFRLEIKTYQTPRLIVQNVQAMRAGAHWMAGQIDAKEGQLLVSAQAMREACKTCNNGNFNFDRNDFANLQDGEDDKNDDDQEPDDDGNLGRQTRSRGKRLRTDASDIGRGPSGEVLAPLEDFMKTRPNNRKPPRPPGEKEKRRLEHLCHILPINGYINNKGARIRLLHYYLCHNFGVSSSNNPETQQQGATPTAPATAAGTPAKGMSALKPVNKPEELLAGIRQPVSITNSGKVNAGDLGPFFTCEQVYKSFPLDLYMQLVGGTRRPEDFEELRLKGARVQDLTAYQYAGLQDSIRYHKMAMSRIGRDLQVLVDLNLLVVADITVQERVDHALYIPVKPHERVYINLCPKLEEPPSTDPSDGAALDGRRWRVFNIMLGSELDAYWAILEHRCLFMVNEAKKLSPLDHPQLATLSNPKTLAWHSLTVMSLQQWDALMDRLKASWADGHIDWINCRRIAHDLQLSYQQVLSLSYRYKQSFGKYGLSRNSRIMAGKLVERLELETDEDKGAASRGKRKMTDEEIEAGRPGPSTDVQISPEEARAARANRTAKRRATGRVNAINLTEDEAARFARHAKLQSSQGTHTADGSNVRGDRFVWDKEMDTALLRALIRYKVKNPLRADVGKLEGLPCGDNLEISSRRVRFLRRINQTSALMAELISLAEKVGERKVQASWQPVKAVPSRRKYPPMLDGQELSDIPAGDSAKASSSKAPARVMLEPWASVHAVEIDMPQGKTLIPPESQRGVQSVLGSSSTRKHYFKEPRPMPKAISNRCRAIISGTNVVSENELTFFPYMNAVGPAMCNATNNMQRAKRISSVTYHEVNAPASGTIITEGRPWREVSALPLFEPCEEEEDIQDSQRLEQLVNSIVDVACYWCQANPAKPLRAHTHAQAGPKGFRSAPSAPTRIIRSCPKITKVHELFDDEAMLSKFLETDVKPEVDELEHGIQPAGWTHMEASAQAAGQNMLKSLIQRQAQGQPLPEVPPTNIAVASEALKGLFHAYQDSNKLPREILRNIKARFTRLELMVAFAYLRRQGALCKANSPFPFRLSRYFQQRLLCQDLSLPATIYDEADETVAANEAAEAGGGPQTVLNGESLTGAPTSEEGKSLTGGAMAVLLHRLASNEIDLQPQNLRFVHRESDQDTDHAFARPDAVMDVVATRTAGASSKGKGQPAACGAQPPPQESVAHLTDGASVLADACATASGTKWRLEDIAKDPAVRVEAEVAFVVHCEYAGLVPSGGERDPTVLLALLRDAGPNGIPLAEVPAHLRRVVRREAGGFTGEDEAHEGAADGASNEAVTAMLAAAIRHGLAAMMMGWQETHVLAGEEAARFCAPSSSSGARDTPRCLRVWLDPQGNINSELAAALEQRALSVVLRCPGSPEDKVVKSLDMVCPMAARLVLAELVLAGALRVRTQPKARPGPPALLLRGKRKASSLFPGKEQEEERFYFPVLDKTFVKRQAPGRFEKPGSQGPIP